MPRYDYRCEFCQHAEERVYPIGDAPAEVTCQCEAMMHRVYTPPAAIHFKGPGFYTTDVKGALHRKRRSNPGDDLPVEHQPDTDAIARAL